MEKLSKKEKMKTNLSYKYHNVYLLHSDYVGRIVGNNIEIIKNRYGKFSTITKKEFLKLKTENHIMMRDNDILYIVPKRYALWFSIRKLRGFDNA